jgi:transposase
VRLLLSPGQTHEMKVAHALLAGVADAYVGGDMAYDAKSLVDVLEARRCTVVIPSNPTRATKREIDTHLYKERHLVENFFQRIKRFRRVAMRFEKLSRNFLAFVQIASVLVLLL